MSKVQVIKCKIDYGTDWEGDGYYEEAWKVVQDGVTLDILPDDPTFLLQKLGIEVVTAEDA